jgi:uncharacterized protein (DUF2384 family)
VTDIQIQSIDAPLSRQGLPGRAFGLVLRATAVGLLPNRERIDRLDIDLVREIARAAAEAGVGKQAALGLLQQSSPAELERLIQQLEDAIVASPLPDRELAELRRTFELDQLAPLLGVSVVSLRRYLAGTRQVPDDIAERAHWLALVAGDLAGSYNTVGVRRWFERPRPQLDGRSPRQVLGNDWTPDQPGVAQVHALAAALVGAGNAT